MVQMLLEFVVLWIAALITGAATGCEVQSDSMNMSGEASQPPSWERLIWCPEGYIQADNNLQLCLPSVCHETTQVTPCPDSFAAPFRDCPKYGSWPDTQYNLLANGTLQILQKGLTIPLGEYWVRGERVVMCDVNGTGFPEARPRWCMPFENVNESTFQLLPKELVAPGHFYENGSMLNFCVTLDQQIENCKRVHIEGEYIELQSNLDLFTNFIIEKVYPVGHYILFMDRSSALICIKIFGTTTRYLCGIASIVSASALFLTLLCHVFYSNRSLHSKSLLCLAFSLLVMYVAMAARLMTSTSTTTPIANLLVFIVQYYFAFAAFLWHSVIGYDLWKAFSEMKAPLQTANHAGKKQAFVAKCVYAFGVPMMMCIIVMSLFFFQGAQAKLGLVLMFQNYPWFIDKKTCFALFSGPVLVILLQNMLFFVSTVCNIWRASYNTSVVRRKASWELFQIYMNLFLVMGMTWFTEVVLWLTRLPNKQMKKDVYMPDLINGWNGLFLLIYVCKRRSLFMVKNRLGCLRSRHVVQGFSSQRSSKSLVTTIALPSLSHNEISVSTLVKKPI